MPVLSSRSPRFASPLARPLLVLAILPLLFLAGACGDDDEDVMLGEAGDACMNDRECAEGLFCDRGQEAAEIRKENDTDTAACEAACEESFPADDTAREACVAACGVEGDEVPGGSFEGGGDVPGQSALPGDDGGAQPSGVIPSDADDLPGGVPGEDTTRGPTPMGTCTPA